MHRAIEHVDDTQPSGTLAERAGDVTVLAEAELSGHRHAIHDRVTMFRNEALARDIPADLYVGHVQIEPPFARVEHNDHDTITLTKGT